MAAFQDIAGQKFYELTAICPTTERKCGAVVWLWQCDCGKTTKTRAALVRTGHTKSCGCRFHREHRTRTEPQICRHCEKVSTRKLPSGYYSKVCHKCANKQGNDSRDYLTTLVGSAKVRAKKADIPFDLEPEDLTLPEFCPVLGIRLERGGPISERDSSPSLDRLVPELGYTLDNVSIISHLANRLKSNGTAEQHRRIADWMDAQTQHNVEVAA